MFLRLSFFFLRSRPRGKTGPCTTLFWPAPPSLGLQAICQFANLEFLTLLHFSNGTKTVVIDIRRFLSSHSSCCKYFQSTFPQSTFPQTTSGRVFFWHEHAKKSTRGSFRPAARGSKQPNAGGGAPTLDDHSHTSHPSHLGVCQVPNRGSRTATPTQGSRTPNCPRDHASRSR